MSLVSSRCSNGIDDQFVSFIPQSNGASSSSSSSSLSMKWRIFSRFFFRTRLVLIICFAISCCLLLSFLGIFAAPPSSNNGSSKLLTSESQSRNEAFGSAEDSVVDPDSAPKCDCRRHCGTKRNIPRPKEVDDEHPRHKLSVIVPFRDRFDELSLFIPSLSKFLDAQNVDFEIIVINQADSHRFNRASLINAGFHLSSADSDYIAMHDVDLWPINHRLSYAYPGAAPYHIAAPGLHPLYNYPTFVGGILLVSKQHFKLVNGLSNLFWGWGREDDDFFLRLKAANLPVNRPSLGVITTGRNATFMHFHGPNRKRDQIRYDQQKRISRQMDTATGLKDVSYSLTRTQNLSIDGYSATIHHVSLTCDYSVTPWCDHLLSEEEIAAVMAEQKRKRAERKKRKEEENVKREEEKRRREEEKREKLEAMAVERQRFGH